MPRSRNRTAREFFEVAKKQAKRDPRVIISDGLDSYRGEYDQVSIANIDQVVHIANVGIRSCVGNHRVERLHNTMREREKVMRNLKRANSAEKILKGFRAYYNYVRPHGARRSHASTRSRHTNPARNEPLGRSDPTSGKKSAWT